MEETDLSRVVEIERGSFPSQWPWTPFKKELTNPLATYLVASRAVDGEQGDAAVPMGVGSPKESSSLSLPGRFFRGLMGVVFALLGARASITDEVEPVDGFIGMSFMVDEVHITSIAVSECCRRRGIGALLLMTAIDLAVNRSAMLLTLEVRVSNVAAQALYEKYGFTRTGVRKEYYTDNKEDAYIMSTEKLTSPGYLEKVEALKEIHREKWGENINQ